MALAYQIKKESIDGHQHLSLVGPPLVEMGLILNGPKFAADAYQALQAAGFCKVLLLHGGPNEAAPAALALGTSTLKTNLEIVAAYDIFPQDHFVGLEYLHTARQEKIPFVLYHHAPRATLHAAEAFQVMQKAKDLQALYISFPYNAALGAAGVMHEGPISFMQGLPGISYLAEELIVSRDIELVRAVKAKVHFHQISSRRSLELIRRAKAEGLPITCGTSAAHLLYTQADCANFNIAAKCLPPLRAEEDRQALVAAIKDHTLDCLSLGHYGTHHQAEDFMQANFTCLPPAHTLPRLYQNLVAPGHVSLADLMYLLREGPANILAGTVAATTLPTKNITWDLTCPC